MSRPPPAPCRRRDISIRVCLPRWCEVETISDVLNLDLADDLSSHLGVLVVRVPHLVAEDDVGPQ